MEKDSREGMKHAFMIIAHNEFVILQRLISALDDERIDIYVHIDKKVREMPVLHANHAGLFILQNRVDVRWGHVSQIECEYALFREAYKPGVYCFYHLISGVHLPLKSLDYILSYYESMVGKNILPHLDCNDEYQMNLKVRRYNILVRWYVYGPKLLQRCAQLVWTASHAVQKRLGITYNKAKDFRVSSNWVSLTEEALHFLVSKQDEALKIFKHSFCGDEWFVATLLYRSFLRETVVSPDDILQCSIGHCNAETFTIEDSDILATSICLWGRKFSSVDMSIVDIVLSI